MLTTTGIRGYYVVRNLRNYGGYRRPSVGPRRHPQQRPASREDFVADGRSGAGYVRCSSKRQ